MKIKSRFFYLLVVNSILSHFLLYVPSTLHKNLYGGTLVSIVLVFLINCLNAYMVLYVFNKYKDNNIVEIYKVLFGKALGLFFSSFHWILNTVLSFFMLRGLVEIIIKYILPATPIYVIMASIMILPYITLLNNLESYLRFLGLITGIILFYTIVQLSLTIKGVHWEYVKGVFTHLSLKPNFTVIAMGSYFFSGLSHLSVFNPVFDKLNPKKIYILFLTLGIPAAAATTIIPVGIWGPIATQRVQLIWAATADTLSTELFIIERVFYILLPLFFLGAICQVLNYGFVSYNLTKILIPNKKLDLILVSITGVLFLILGQYFQGTDNVVKAGSITMIISFLAYQVLSLMMFIVCKVKERGAVYEETL